MNENDNRLGVFRLQSSGIRCEATSRVLVLYEEKISFLGDACIRFGKLKYFSYFLNKAKIDVNFSKRENAKFSDAFLLCNPHVNKITMLNRSEIDFHKYDVLFCVTYDEAEFSSYLLEQYGSGMVTGGRGPQLLSLSKLMLPERDASHVVFPQSDQLARYVDGAQRGANPGELYLCREERAWADLWLKSQGLRENEDLFILCDSASSREKLLNVVDYFKLLNYLLSRSNARILIFDEQGIGKREFYKGWLDNRDFNRLIVSERLSLRQDLCLIGSRQTRLVFGPCTGLMHCSSSIYNEYVNEEGSAQKMPAIIVYTGKYSKRGQSAESWWGDCPLVKCLLLKVRDGREQVISLDDLSEEEKICNDSLPCSSYTAELLVPIVESCLTKR